MVGQGFFALTGDLPVSFPPIFVIVLVLMVVLAYGDLARIISLPRPAAEPSANEGRYSLRSLLKKWEFTRSRGSTLREKMQFVRDLDRFLHIGVSVYETRDGARNCSVSIGRTSVTPDCLRDLRGVPVSATDDYAPRAAANRIIAGLEFESFGERHSEGSDQVQAACGARTQASVFLKVV